jgi:hypothetical protein
MLGIRGLLQQRGYESKKFDTLLQLSLFLHPGFEPRKLDWGVVSVTTWIQSQLRPVFPFRSRASLTGFIQHAMICNIQLGASDLISA